MPAQGKAALPAAFLALAPDPRLGKIAQASGGQAAGLLPAQPEPVAGRLVAPLVLLVLGLFVLVLLLVVVVARVAWEGADGRPKRRLQWKRTLRRNNNKNKSTGKEKQEQ